MRPGLEGQPAGECQWQAEMDANLIKALGRVVYRQDLLDTQSSGQPHRAGQVRRAQENADPETLKMTLLQPRNAEQIGIGRVLTGVIRVICARTIAHERL